MIKRRIAQTVCVIKGVLRKLHPSEKLLLLWACLTLGAVLIAMRTSPAFLYTWCRFAMNPILWFLDYLHVTIIALTLPMALVLLVWSLARRASWQRKCLWGVGHAILVLVGLIFLQLILMNRNIYRTYLGNYAFTDWRQKIEEKRQGKATPVVAPPKEAQPHTAQKETAEPLDTGGLFGSPEENETTNE